MSKDQTDTTPLPEFIESVMLEFRQFVVGIQEEQQSLKAKLCQFKLKSPPASTVDSHNSLSSNSNHTSNSILRRLFNRTPTTATASPTDESYSATLYSCPTLTTSNSSTRPPSYKTVIKLDPLHSNLQPLPPVRSKRRSLRANTMSTTGATLSRGALIVFEGLDRVGKSTLAKKLVEHLERVRRTTAYLRFPDRTTAIGKLINEFLTSKSKQIDDHALHLLFSANRWELQSKIRNSINQGTTVVVDRYSFSGIAYSSAGTSLSIDWCRELEKGLPKPDLVIYLELPKEEQYTRTGFGDERFESKGLQELIRKQYEILIDNNYWLRLDVSNKSPDQLLGEIIVPVRECIETNANKDLGVLDFP